MPNTVRIGVGVDDHASRPIHNIHEAWKRLQRDGAAGLTAGVAAAASIKAFDLTGQAIGRVTDFLGESVRASIEEAAGIQRLSTSLRANVPAWDGNTTAIEATIRKREALAFSDDDLRNSLGRLVGATRDVSKAFSLQSLAMDLARFKGIDLADASEEIIRVNAGQYRSLKALGIEIDASATREQALAEVHRVTAGQAETFASTTAGAMQAAGIAVHDLQEEIGQKLAPAVRDIANFARQSLIPALSGVVENADKLMPVLEGIALALSLKVAQGAAAAVAGIAGIGPAALVSAGTTAEAGAVMEGTARATATAWRTAIATILILPEALHLVGDAYESVRKTIFGSNPVLDQWNQIVKKGAAGASDDAQALQDQASAALKAAQAAGEHSQATEEDTGAIAKLIAATDYLATTTIPDVVDAFAAAQVGAGMAAGQIGSIGVAADLSTDSLDKIGGAAIDTANDFASLAIKAKEAYSVATNVLLAVGGMGAETLSSAQARALGVGGIEAGGSVTFVAKHRGGGGVGGVGGVGGGGDTAAEKEKKATEALAAALRDKLRAAYDVARQAAERTFDTIHQRNLKAISDARDQANATAEVTYQLRLQDLEAQKAALYQQANVDALSLSADQQARTLRDLQDQADDAQKALADAMAGGDPQTIEQAQRRARNASEALSDFQREAAIATERRVADESAKGLDLKEQAAKDDLEAAKRHNDDQYAQQVDAENTRYQDEKDAYGRAYELLRAHLDDSKNLHSSVNKAILAEYDQYLAKYEAKGREIGKSLLKGLKGELRVTLPGVTVSGTAGEWRTLAGGEPVSREAGATGEAPTGTRTDTISVNINVTVQGSVVDPNSQVAYQIADQLVVGLEKAFAQRGISTGGATAGTAHTHPVAAA